MGTAFLAFITIYFSGRKAIWLQRLKSEILAVGIITLVLNGIEPALSSICVGADETDDYAGAASCDAGQRPLFSPHLIHETHLLLFITALIHVIITCLSFYVCLAKMKSWRAWERRARSGGELEIFEAFVARAIGRSWLGGAAWAVWAALTGGLNPTLYNLNRTLFKLRIDDAAVTKDDRLPRHFNFLNVVEQVMELEFVSNSGQNILMFFLMAIFLAIPRGARGIYILTLLSLLLTIVVSAMYSSLVAQLSATSLHDFHDAIDATQHERGFSLGRVPTRKDPGEQTGGLDTEPRSPPTRLGNITAFFGSLKNGLTGRGDHSPAPVSPHSGWSSLGSAGNATGPRRQPGSPEHAVGEGRDVEMQASDQGNARGPLSDWRGVALGSSGGQAPPASRGSQYTHDSGVTDGHASRTTMSDSSVASTTSTPQGVWGRPRGGDTTLTGAKNKPLAAVVGITGASNKPRGAGGPPLFGGGKVAPLGEGISAPRDMQATLVKQYGAEVVLRGRHEDIEEVAHRIRLRLVDPDHPGGPLLRAKPLYPFGSPWLLVFLQNLCYMGSALALTLLFYGLWQDQSCFIARESLWLIIVAIVVNVALLLYAAIVVQPLSALVATVGTRHPGHLVREIKKQKLINEEDYMEGVGGIAIRWCCSTKTSPHTASHTPATRALPGGGGPKPKLMRHNSFILMLADQAGVIAARGKKASGSHLSLDLHEHFTRMWQQRASDLRAGTPKDSYTVTADLAPIRRAFNMIDTNESGSIGTAELASVLTAMGTRATSDELEDMVNEIDHNNSSTIDFSEFCCFLVFKFFDPDNDGFIVRTDVQQTLQTINIECAWVRGEAEDPDRLYEAERLMDYCVEMRGLRRDTSRTRMNNADLANAKRRMSLADFIHVFQDTKFVDGAATEPPTAVEAVRAPPVAATVAATVPKRARGGSDSQHLHKGLNMSSPVGKKRGTIDAYFAKRVSTVVDGPPSKRIASLPESAPEPLHPSGLGDAANASTAGSVDAPMGTWAPHPGSKPRRAATAAAAAQPAAQRQRQQPGGESMEQPAAQPVAQQQQQPDAQSMEQQQQQQQPAVQSMTQPAVQPAAQQKQAKQQKQQKQQQQSTWQQQQQQNDGEGAPATVIEPADADAAGDGAASTAGRASGGLVELLTEPSWLIVLGPEFSKPYFKELQKYVVAEMASKTVYPPKERVFRAFNACAFDRIKVVIIGQDPYHGPRQAVGLSFSVPPGEKVPSSLQNIFKELRDDLGCPVPNHGDLRAWADQGVLLLNACLTVRAGEAASHSKKGWESLTDCAIRSLASERDGLVFLLWGKFAQDKAKLIDSSRHHVLTCPHPSGLSAHRGFFGSRHFSKANALLQEGGQAPIEWGIPRV
ncbi:hypothetical protein FOA52_012733 [Chlamydomonas sp. UWO 241]|nr:hypothetical protein FOA52_012733 [Chlamydomonas sp. UWO 241]